MSWTVSFSGKPEAVAIKLQDYASTLEELSQKEFRAVLPHLIGLVKKNKGHEDREIGVVAFGHEVVDFTLGEERRLSTCSVTIHEHDPLI